VNETMQAVVKGMVESPARASKGNPVAARQLATALSVAKTWDTEAYAYAIELARACRKDTLRIATHWQRKWGAGVSRRVGRGRHDDSWAIREKYVRCGSRHNDYLGYAHSVLASHPAWEKRPYANTLYLRKDRI